MVVSVGIVDAPPPDTVPFDTENAFPPDKNKSDSSVGSDIRLTLVQHLLIRYTSSLKFGLQLIDAYRGLLFNPIDPGYCTFRTDASARIRRLFV